MDTITVCVDSREKRPLLFPATLKYKGRRYPVVVERVTAPAGDYYLKGCEAFALVERKASLRELHQNLVTEDFPRFHRAIARLSDKTLNPILLVESTAADLMLPSKLFPDPGGILQRLFEVGADHSLHYLFVGECKFPAKRRLVGEFILRILLSYVPETATV
jgi:hypothetical protein